MDSPMNSSIGNRRRALGASGNVCSIFASPTNPICRRSLPHLGGSVVLQWRRSRPDGLGAGSSAASWSPRRRASALPLRDRSSRGRVLSVLDRFLSGNQSCRDLILRAGGNDINRIRFWNPFLPGLRFTVGTGLEIIVSRERRHLLQAKRVKDLANFPR